MKQQRLGFQKLYQNLVKILFLFFIIFSSIHENGAAEERFPAAPFFSVTAVLANLLLSEYLHITS